MFITLVGTLVFLRQEPHCVLEVRERGDGRLARIFALMQSCRMSIHDISRAGVPARFNMPFELGLACAIKLADPAAYEVFLLDAKPFRVDRNLSDYKGRDPLIHGGSCDGMVACLLDAFEPAAGTPADFRRAARVLRKSAGLMKQQMKSPSLFRPSLFRALIVVAMQIARDHEFLDVR
ncbi:MAG TPA: hypothetical protein VEO54_19615 [Thermoanaerobaculia bacterium]|nr:hypothetical protein [Thermoanaerobaculia bacterium]